MKTIKEQYRRMVGKRFPFEAEPGLEVIYRDLFQRELKQLGEEDRFFPVGGAANYSLLYLILRIGIELQPRSVLDIGAGQSTILWAMLQRRGLVETILTLEGDAEWAARIGAQVDHAILVTPLTSATINGHPTMTYDWEQARQRGPFDAIICDGPNGTPRHSRNGVLNMVTEDMPKNFVLVMDDSERPGEQDTVREIHQRLIELKVDYGVGVVRAAKTQVVFASGRFMPATFL